MYTQLFGLKQEPFSIAPDPRFLYMSERHREALAHLLYGVRAGGGFVLLTGEIGAGKTTVCRCFLEQVPKACNVAYIFNPKLSVLELLETVCQEFGIEGALLGAQSVKAHVDVLNQFLLRMHAIGKTSVLVIDEAQNLSADVLEQLRLLTNLETNERKLLQIVLIGQPELRQLIAQPRMEQLAQRVIARYHLQALDEAETARYVRHRLSVAGLTGGLPFDRAALRRIHRATGGVPRRINLLCDRALLGAYGEGRRRVDARMIDAAAAEVFDRPASGRAWPGARAAVLGGAAVVALGAALAIALRSPTPAPTAATAAAPSLPAPPAPVPAAPAAPIEVPPPTLTAAAFAARQPWTDEAAAWRALGLRWQIDIDAADPCRTVETLGLACYRNSTTLAVLRQLDRPVLLGLRGGEGAPGWALLTGLDGEQASLQLADGPATVSLATLATAWRGDFATLWRRPPGYSGQGAAVAQGATGRWLRERLDRFQGDDLPAGATLRQRIEAFQLAQGLKADGLAGPMTLMQLNRAAGEAGPRLARN